MIVKRREKNIYKDKHFPSKCLDLVILKDFLSNIMTGYLLRGRR